MSIYLVRHAHAGDRSAWRGDDRQRPLSDKGREQAAAIGAELSAASVGRVLSSPSRRCTETVDALASRLGLQVETRLELDEGAEPDPAIALLLACADENPVACSHGDVIPKIIRRLVSAGMRTPGPSDSQKGSVWILEVEQGAVVSGTYVPPAVTTGQRAG